MRNRERGFVPPVATRKLRTRVLRRRKESQLNIILSLILCCLLGLFIVYTLWYMKSMREHRQASETSEMIIENKANLRAWISEDSQPFNENNSASRVHHLIIVAGHSVTISGHLEDAGSDESDWFLLDYQKGQGLPQAIKGHIQAGIDLAKDDPDSLLIFSGGETRAKTGPFTEGASYYHAADAMKMWPLESTVRARTVTEEFATDSFENLFHEVTGNYPTKISMVSFSFKRRRFESLHSRAIGWPKEQFYFLGVDPPASTGFDLLRATEGEWLNAAAPFETDPYGCHSEVLKQKRKSRNPFSRIPPYPLSCPEMKELLSYCGPEYFPRSKLPWPSI